MELYLVINIKNQQEMVKSKIDKREKSAQLDYWIAVLLDLVKF